MHSTGKQSLFNLRIISNTKLHNKKLYVACIDHWCGNVGTIHSTCQVAAVKNLLMHTRTLNACNGSIPHGSVLFLVAPCISQNHLISTPTNAYIYIYTMHIHIRFFTLKHLKSLQHVSILRSSSGSYNVPC